MTTRQCCAISDTCCRCAPGTEQLPLPDLLAAQHYELACWRTAAAELNWRRFFDISSLIAIRVEEPDVFAATHGLLLGLVAEGLIDGLRIDHPDGLADPRGYLRQLATATGGRWIVAEKILAAGEELPSDWPCAGTTGYDALAAVGAVLTDPAGVERLGAQYVEFAGGAGRFRDGGVGGQARDRRPAPGGGGRPARPAARHGSTSRR